MKCKITIGGIIFAIAITIFVGMLLKSQLDCKESGGIPVKGLFWIECIN